MSIGVVAAHAASGGGISSYSAAVLADAPLVYWRLGDGSGTTAADSSGNGHSATWDAAPSYVSGLLSSDPDGAIKPNSHYASINHAAWMDVSALTVEAIVKYDTVVSNSAFVERYGSGASGVSSFLFWTPGSKFSFAIRDSTVADRSATDTATVAAGTKYHVVGTADGSNVNLYVNGALVATAVSSTLATPASAPIVIGKTVFNSLFTAGTIDEVAVYGSAMSAARIAVHAAAA